MPEGSKTAAQSKESRPHCESLFEHVYDGIVIVDPSTGQIVDANSRASQLVGRGVEQLRGTSSDALFKDQVQSYHRGLLARASRGESVLGECELAKEGGFVTSVEVAYSCCKEQGKVWVVLMMRDLSERKRIDRERDIVENRRNEAQRLDSLNVLVGGVAHDFNNILMSILSYAIMGKDMGAQDSQIRRFFSQIETSTMRAGDLCRKMLAFAGRGEVSLQPGRINEIVASLEPTLRSIIGSKAELEVSLMPENPELMLDGAKLPQVLLCILQNALESLNRGEKRICISTRFSQEGDPLRHEGFVTPEIPRGDAVIIEVKDTGSGISQEHITRIFDPFFSTKFVGRGLGLSEALGMVRAHRGVIQVSSQLGHGSIFRIYLPLPGNSGVTTPGAQSAPPFLSSAMQRPLALVVDDMDSNLEYVDHILKECGFSVRTAPDGVSALRHLEESGSRITLVILDFSMPEISGSDLLQKIRSSRHRDMRVVIMSGYSQEEVYERCYPFRPDAFLSKPFTANEVKKVIS